MADLGRGLLFVWVAGIVGSIAVVLPILLAQTARECGSREEFRSRALTLFADWGMVIPIAALLWPVLLVGWSLAMLFYLGREAILGVFWFFFGRR